MPHVAGEHRPHAPCPTCKGTYFTVRSNVCMRCTQKKANAKKAQRKDEGKTPVMDSKVVHISEIRQREINAMGMPEDGKVDYHSC